MFSVWFLILILAGVIVPYVVIGHFTKLGNNRVFGISVAVGMLIIWLARIRYLYFNSALTYDAWLYMLIFIILGYFAGNYWYGRFTVPITSISTRLKEKIKKL